MVERGDAFEAASGERRRGTRHRACIRRGQPGPFQLQAAIRAVHCAAESFEATDWPQVVALYDHLLTLTPTPVIALNRAIAMGEIAGPDVALTAIDAIAFDLVDYHLMHAARGAMLRRLGRWDAASAAYERAADLAATGVGPAVSCGPARRVDRRQRARAYRSGMIGGSSSPPVRAVWRDLTAARGRLVSVKAATVDRTR